MGRLTRKKKNLKIYVFDRDVEYPNFEDGLILLQIVGKFEDLEEEIGCPLEVLKSNQKVEFIKGNETLCADVMGINIQSKKIMIGNAWSFTELPLNQYKKTWWIKEDKSEENERL